MKLHRFPCIVKKTHKKYIFHFKINNSSVSAKAKHSWWRMQILFTASCLILNNLTSQNEHYWLLPFSTLRFSLRALELFASNWQALILVQPSSPVTRLVPGTFSTSEPSGIRLQYCNFIIIIINFVDRDNPSINSADTADMQPFTQAGLIDYLSQ